MPLTKSEHAQIDRAARAIVGAVARKRVAELRLPGAGAVPVSLDVRHDTRGRVLYVAARLGWSVEPGATNTSVPGLLDTLVRGDEARAFELARSAVEGAVRHAIGDRAAA